MPQFARGSADVPTLAWPAVTRRNSLRAETVDVHTDTVEHEHPEGTIIRFMGEHTVLIPLWGPGGLMFSGPERLVDAGIDPALAREVAQWGEDWQTLSGAPDLHLRAVELIERLRPAFDRWYTIVYQP
jgi:hypothetical protein